MQDRPASTRPTPTLNIVGAGRVGTTLGALFSRNKHFTIGDVCNASMPSAATACDVIGTGRSVSQLSQMRPADIWLIGAPDSMIEQVASDLADVSRQWLDQSSAPLSPASLASSAPIVFHCSGFLASTALAPLAERGWRTASVHPVMSFASAHTALKQFAGTLCGIEGMQDASATLRQAFETIGASCFDVATEKKALYHAGAVFSTNFTVVVQQLAGEAWREAGVPSALIPQLMDNLLRNTTANIQSLGPADALTGPAARGDQDVVATQGNIVAQWDALAGKAYRTLSEIAMRIARTRNAKR